MQDYELVSADAPERGSEPAENAGASFPRSSRLLRHSDFERVYKQGRRHFSPHMTVFYLRRAIEPCSDAARVDGAPSERCSRIGFTVGRALGGAVERNRIKRRLREAVRLRRTVLSAAVDVVINPRKTVLTLEFSAVVQEVGRALELIAKKMRG